MGARGCCVDPAGPDLRPPSCGGRSSLTGWLTFISRQNGTPCKHFSGPPWAEGAGETFILDSWSRELCMKGWYCFKPVSLNIHTHPICTCTYLPYVHVCRLHTPHNMIHVIAAYCKQRICNHTCGCKYDLLRHDEEGRANVSRAGRSSAGQPLALTKLHLGALPV